MTKSKTNFKITILPGDGIGPEVTREAVRVLHSVEEVFDCKFELNEKLIGGGAIRRTGSPFPVETLDACMSSDAVLLGAVGDPEFDKLPANKRPEAGLLLLRRSLGGFANLRPVVSFPSIEDCSPLRPEIVRGADILIVRELLGGLYFGEPRAIISDNGRSYAFNTMNYNVEEIERVARVAFELARDRRKKVTSVDKANVLETSQLWRQVVNEVAVGFPDVELDHMYVDACAMNLIMNPRRFDVLLTENLFGDILSDEAAVITGSLGMLASASIGGEVDLYEPVHGSAPDIAGKGIANPLGAIASIAMMMRHTARHELAATAIEDAIKHVLESGFRTPDLRGMKRGYVATTEEIGSLVAEALASSADMQHAYHAV